MSDPHNINPVLARALEKKGYASLTEVQEAVIAPETDGRDLLVSAQTGSGKTVAFGLAITPTILGTQEVFGPAVLPQALVVAPTRELAIQVQRELTWLFGEAKGKIASCVGGMDPRAERRALARGAHVVRSEEHTSELQSPVPISYAVFCLKKKKKYKKKKNKKNKKWH